MALRQAGALLLILLTACASTARHASQGSLPGPRWYEVDDVAPGTGATRPVPVDRSEFQRALVRLARDRHWDTPPQEAARALLETGLEGEWVAEVSRGHVLSLLPQEESPLVSQEVEALKAEYARWCQTRGGGDCLGLYADGPSLRADDRRTLAFALAFASVLDETREALVRETLNPRAVVATLAWTGAMYLTLWLVPEPATKAIAGVLTVALVSWLGVDALWSLMDGWARLAHRANEARTFAELRDAGDEYARTLGEHTARALVMAVGAVLGSGTAEAAARVRALPGYVQALAQAEAQGVRLEALAEVEAVAASSEGEFSVLMRERGGGGTAGAAPEAPQEQSITTVLQHRGGNQQVVLANGQRWHLPRGVSPSEIPASDPLGDELQAAATRIAKKWGPGELTPTEEAAIQDALDKGHHFQASRLQGQARGRWVQEQMKREFKHLKWNSRGVDITGPNGSKYHYEVLAGTEDNFGRHGRRMSDVFFRMIFF